MSRLSRLSRFAGAGAVIRPADQWGPFRPDLEPGERLARTRALRAVAHLVTGPRGADLCARLREAERDPAALPLALGALDRLAPVDRRHVLATFAALHRPAA